MQQHLNVKKVFWCTLVEGLVFKVVFCTSILHLNTCSSFFTKNIVADLTFLLCFDVLDFMSLTSQESPVSWRRLL